MIDQMPSPTGTQAASSIYIDLDGTFDPGVFELDVHRIWTAMASDPKRSTAAFIEFATETDSRRYIEAVAEGVAIDWSLWITFTCPRAAVDEQLQRLQGYALMLREIGLERQPSSAQDGAVA